MQKTPLEQKYNLKLILDKDYFVKEEHWLPRRMGVQYFAFGKTLYCDRKVKVIPSHEFLHIAQFNKYGTVRVIGHYIYHLVINYKNGSNLGEAFRRVLNLPQFNGYFK